MDWSGLAIAVAPYEMVVGPALAILVWAVRRTTPWLLTAAFVLTGAAIWWIDVWLIFSSAGGLGGVMDCYPYCSRSQDAASAMLFYAPVLTAVFIAGLVLASGVHYVRRTRGRALT